VEVLSADGPAAEQALDGLEELYTELDRDWRTFGPGELGRVNAALLAGQSARLSPRLAGLVRRSLEFRPLTDGLFDPRIGALVALWGFDDMAHATPVRPPDEGSVAALRHRTIDAGEVHLEADAVWSDAPLSLDLNGLAEGAALAAGAALLRSSGITAALLDTGGDLVAVGSHGNRPWRVGVRDPRGPGNLGTVALQPGETIASSGGYEHRFQADGKTFHHILDPRTGSPSRGATGTTVIAMDAELADAAATALMVAGPARFAEIGERMGIDTALLVTEDGRVLMTPRMQERLHRR
jgi:thiamine biosynthesis lipoprotein